MKIAIIQFPGSNCESESIRAVRTAGLEAEEFLWNRDYRDLANFDGYFIVGGFSYEDRSRAGIISALDPIIPRLKIEAETGKPILGVCNGAQILVETGLVPGLKNHAVGLALAENKRVQNGKVVGTGFYNTWVYIQLAVPSSASAFSLHLKPGQLLHIPVAHGEGRFVIPEELLEEMKANHLTTFRYCDDRGKISEEFPVNPNGTAYNLAAVTNVSGNIMAIMPHPERAPQGQPIFTSLREYIADKKTINLSRPLNYRPPPFQMIAYSPPKNTLEIVTELIITDNEAATVENALQRIGVPVQISRATHWEVSLDQNNAAEQMKDTLASSGELFNHDKERLVTQFDSPVIYLLVRFKADTVGAQKKQEIHNRLGLTTINGVKRGTLWKITAPRGSIEGLLERAIETHILFNQFSQDCFIWNTPTSSSAALTTASPPLT